jgi:hypothetical protein
MVVNMCAICGLVQLDCKSCSSHDDGIVNSDDVGIVSGDIMQLLFILLWSCAS